MGFLSELAGKSGTDINFFRAYGAVRYRLESLIEVTQLVWCGIRGLQINRTGNQVFLQKYTRPPGAGTHLVQNSQTVR